MWSLLTVSEVRGETGWKSFSGDCVRHWKSRHATRLLNCFRAIRLMARRGIRRRSARSAWAGRNRSLRRAALPQAVAC